MADSNPVGEVRKMARIWSDRKEKNICVCIHYSFEEQGDCKIYTLGAVEECD